MSRVSKTLLSVFLRAWGKGRVTNLLTVVVALTLATFTPALAANGQPLIMGLTSNSATAVTRLTANIANPTLQLWNTKTGPGATALSLVTSSSRPPLAVNSSTKVANLNADLVDGQSFTCPSGTLFHEGVCIETTKRAIATPLDATTDCLDEGKRLPTVAELQTFRLRKSIKNLPAHDFTTQEWTSQLDHNGTTLGTITVRPDGYLTWVGAGSANYRCVVPPS